MVYLSLGSNLSDREAHLRAALDCLALRIGRIKAISSFYETEPVGKKDQPDFLNCCVACETSLLPKEVLKMCLSIESELGRVRKEHWGPRTIDIDILFYDNLIMESDALELPHPRLHERRFVLQPMSDIAPDFPHPLFKKSIKELLKECKDDSIVKRLHGNAPTQKTRNATPNRHSLGRS